MIQKIIYKFIFIFALSIVLLVSVYAQNKPTVQSDHQKIDLSKTDPLQDFNKATVQSLNQPVHQKIDQSQDFYKATVQAYKDFNEQIVSTVRTALVIVSGFITILVFLFVFLFRKTLAEIRKDLKEDSERVEGVYSKTFELLNEQAKANLAIFKSREEELRALIKEGQDLYGKLRTIATEISDNQKIREPIAQELGAEEVERMEDTRKKTEAEFKEIRKGLTEEKEKYDE